MRKLQIIVAQVSDLFFLRDTRDAAISCKQYDSATEPKFTFMRIGIPRLGYIYTYGLMESQSYAMQMQLEDAGNRGRAAKISGPCHGHSHTGKLWALVLFSQS